MKKTTAQVKDDRLNIMASNARTASVVSLEMDKVREGGFIINETKDGGSALEFKPAGRKTGDVLAVYNQSSDAAKALEVIFKAIGNGKKGTKNIIVVILYLIKILFLTFLVLFVLGVILFYALGNAVKDVVQDNVNVSTVVVDESTVENIDEPLPLGEPFPVDRYVETLEK